MELGRFKFWEKQTLEEEKELSESSPTEHIKWRFAYNMVFLTESTEPWHVYEDLQILGDQIGYRPNNPDSPEKVETDMHVELKRFQGDADMLECVKITIKGLNGKKDQNKLILRPVSFPLLSENK